MKSIDHNLPGNVARRALALDRLNRVIRRPLPADLRNHVHAVGIKKETLTVATDSAAWASKLRFLESTLTSACNQALDTRVRRVRVRVIAPVPARQARTGPRLSAAGQECLQAAAEGMEDSKLKRALGRLARQRRK